MKKIFLCGMAGLTAMCVVSAYGAPDYRPKFDKTPYKGTLWTQVNPWWPPSKQRADDSGGANYAWRQYKYTPANEWGEAQKDTYRYGGLKDRKSVV